MSAAVNPIENPQAWDVIYLGQTPSPGMCKLGGGFDRTYEWDTKKGKGTIGATSTFVQGPPVEGTITFYLWKVAHFTEWGIFRNLLKYDPLKKTAQAVDIYHPALADLTIHSVVTKKIGKIVHEGKQLYSITVDFLEYFPAPKKSATGTPTGSKNNAKKPAGTPSDPVADAQQAEIKRLLAEAGKP